MTAAITAPPGAGPRVLRRAEDRREELLAAAQHEFAGRGFYGTPTADIARRAGISHAYLFRLFRTKEELFIACVERCHAMVLDAFRMAAAPHSGDTDAAFVAMAEAYMRLLSETDLLANQLHSHA
ncbi:MAG: TetR family transcriptional regulator, partial [Actinobacteria bacterium]|nr:TetR family transcriptional regulator [Actinomycetota bacterium]